MINYAVIGCGVIGNVHANAIINDRQSNLKIVCDIIPERADKIARQYNCRASYNYDEILNNPAIDAIAICLPHSDHIALYEKALSFGKHVICEKPLATNSEDLYKMVDLSEKTEYLTTALFQHRFSPLIQSIHSLISKGSFGEILSGELNFTCERDMNYYKTEEWRGKWATEGGGTLINQAIHTIDLAKSFLGEPGSISGQVEKKYLQGIEVEDFAAGRVYFENNRFLSLKVENKKDGGWQPILKITGSRGSFTLKGSDELTELQTDSPRVKELLLSKESFMKKNSHFPGKQCYGNLHNLAFSDFSDSIINKRKPYISIKEASSANEIVLGFYHSTSTGKTVGLPIKKYEQPLL